MSVQTRESIYNLIPDPLPPKVKSLRHKSKFNDTVRQETKYYKTNNKTMVSRDMNEVKKCNYI